MWQWQQPRNNKTLSFQGLLVIRTDLIGKLYQRRQLFTKTRQCKLYSGQREKLQRVPRPFLNGVNTLLLTEITQSATGFFRAFSEVSFSLASSIPVTCSIAKGRSSSRYRTCNQGWQPRVTRPQHVLSGHSGNELVPHTSNEQHWTHLSI